MGLLFVGAAFVQARGINIDGQGVVNSMRGVIAGALPLLVFGTEMFLALIIAGGLKGGFVALLVTCR
ncbi:MAG: hypothetical protein WDA16_09675 [Candidatus Thermoplasmatota archaeon]